MTQEEIRKHKENWLKLVQIAENEPEFRAMVYEKIKRNPIYFFNQFLWTYDPRRDIKIMPFRLWDFQEEFILKLEAYYTQRKHVLVEKSRDMGFSWLVLGFILWKMTTLKGFSAGVGSRKMLLVDDLGNMKALLPRLRFMLHRLPKFLRFGYNEGKHSKSGLIMLPELNTSVSGEAGDDIGRGDRTSLYLIDEYAHIPRSSLVHEAVSDTSDFIIFGSTPKGKGNEFSRLRWKTDIERITLHWKRHPNKNQAWYEKKKQTMTEEQIAQELDISYNKSMKGRVYKWFDVDKHANEAMEYNSLYPIEATFDWGIGDPTACIIFQYYRGIMHIIGFYEIKDADINEIFRLLQVNLEKWNLKIKDLSAIYGDPDGRNRNIITGNSIADFIRQKYGFTLRFKLPNIIRNRIMSVKILGNANRIKIDKDLGYLIECLENYRYPDKEHGENEKPLHDWTSHACSALEYYCDYEHGMDQYKKQEEITQTRFR